jgi:hypothetical protein
MMKNLTGLLLVLAAIVAATPLTGCNKSASPPPPLAADQIPTELQKAYAKAKPEFKDVVQKISSAMQEKDYPGANAGIQYLFNATEGTKQQRSVTARAMLTINQLLQEAQAKGDAKAAAVIQSNKRYK